MDELKKLFRRSKSKTRQSNSSTSRTDNASSSQNLSPGRPAPTRQRSNTLPTLPTNIPAVNTRYDDLSDGRAPTSGTTPGHARKASLPARKPVAVPSPVVAQGDSSVRARSETRNSSAPSISTQPAPYGSQVASAQSYGNPALNSGYGRL